MARQPEVNDAKETREPISRGEAEKVVGGEDFSASTNCCQHLCNVCGCSCRYDHCRCSTADTPHSHNP